MRAATFKWQNHTLQLHPVLESIAHFLAQHMVGTVDGIKGNGNQLGQRNADILADVFLKMA